MNATTWPRSLRRLVILDDGQERYLCLCCHRPKVAREFTLNSLSDNDRGRAHSACHTCCAAKVKAYNLAHPGLAADQRRLRDRWRINDRDRRARELNGMTGTHIPAGGER